MTIGLGIAAQAAVMLGVHRRTLAQAAVVGPEGAYSPYQSPPICDLPANRSRQRWRENSVNSSHHQSFAVARPRRRLGGFVSALAVAIAGASCLSGQAMGSNPGHPVVWDPVLTVPIPQHWFAGGGTTTALEAGSKRAMKFVIAANFDIRHHSVQLTQGALPAAPAGRLLVSVRHFAPMGPAKKWPAVNRLQLPTPVTAGRFMTSRVRFDGEAVVVTVEFGSPPSARATSSMARFLAAIHHT